MQTDKLCGAKTRSNGTCKNRAMENGRCRMHGGKSLKGTDSPRFVHGIYSKYAGEQIKDVLADLDNVSSDELIQPEQEIRLMSALIMKCKGIENGADDLKDLDIISKILERLIHAKQRSQQIMIQQQLLVPASDIERFLDFLESRLIERMGESEGYQLIEEFKNFKLSAN